MSNPIWKDYNLQLGSGAYADYRVSVDGLAVYEGRAYKRPQESVINVVPNDIIAAYLKPTRPTLTHCVVTTQSDAVKTIGFNNLTSGRSYSEVFMYDYSLLESLPPANAPISRDIVRGVFVPVSTYSAQENADIEINELNAAGESIAGVTSASGGAECMVYDTAEMNTAAKALEVLIDGIGTTYNVADSCKRYVLLYCNAFGGWDTLVLATAKRMDKYERLTFSDANRNTHEIRADYTTEWACNTPLLTDEGAGNMWHLLGSSHVYMYDTLTRQPVPVVISAESCEFRTYKNQAGKLFNYSFNVVETAKKQRK